MEFWRRNKLKGKGKRKGKEEERSEWFLQNGSKFLEELIKDCNGISNPIRMFSSHQILTATDAECCIRFSKHYAWSKAFIEGRPYTFKSFTGSEFIGGRGIYNDIALSARASNHSGFLKLIGCSLEFDLPIIVFENAEYGVLNDRGNVGSEEEPLLPWYLRLTIAKKVAIAVTYFHTAFPRIIIHRNIKPENIFLDKNWNAKLTDFSKSITLPEGKSWIKDKSWIEDGYIGTMGYVDPLYYTTGLVTEYTDVYSFGIFMLVLLMGRPAFSAHWYILDYVKDLRERGEPVEFGGESSNMRPGQMKMFLELALRCCEDSNEDRPKMIMVAKEIKLIEISLDFQT